MADVQCAFLVVVAVQRSCAYALAPLADVNDGAHCAVIALNGVGCEDTSAGRDARVVGADIAVIALDTRSRADAIGASVGFGAGIVVIATVAIIHRFHLANACSRNANVF